MTTKYGCKQQELDAAKSEIRKTLNENAKDR